MSQDDDGCRIKWQASPQHHSLTPSQVKKNTCSKTGHIGSFALCPIICISAALVFLEIPLQPISHVHRPHARQRTTNTMCFHLNSTGSDTQ